MLMGLWTITRLRLDKIMPNSIVKSIADKASAPVDIIQTKWEEAKKKVEDRFPTLDKNSKEYYQKMKELTSKAAGVASSVEIGESDNTFEESLKESYEELNSL